MSSVNFKGKLLETAGSKLYYDNKVYNLPKGCSGNNITVVDDAIYIDGYQFIDGKFKKNLRAIFHKIF